MVDQRIEKLAQLSVDYSVSIKPHEKVLIQGTELAFPLINELYKQCLQKNAYPTVVPRLNLQYTFYKYAKEHQLKFVSPFEKALFENVDVSITIFCEPSPRGLSNIDPNRIRTASASRKELSDFHYKRVSEGKLRWTGLAYPINAQAQEAAMSMEEYETSYTTAASSTRKTLL